MGFLKYCWLLIFTMMILNFGLISEEKYKVNHFQNPSDINVNYAQRIKQGFNLRVWLSNQMALGLEAWDGSAASTPDGIGCEYPAGAMIEHLYGAGPLIGARIDGVIRVSEGYNGSDARKEILPTYPPIPGDHFWRTSLGNNNYDSIGYNGYYFNNNILVNRKGVDDDGDGLIDEDELDGLDNDGDWNPLTDDVGADGLPDSIEISCDGIPYDTLSNPDPADDNFNPAVYDFCHPNLDGTYPYKNNRDIYTEKNNMPDHGEPHVDEDYGAISQNDLYCSATDTFRRPTIPGHSSMGLKVFSKTYSWEKNSSCDAIVFLEYNFINVGKRPWQNAYVGMFADPDLGPVNTDRYFEHNCTAYDYLTRTGYIYNPVDTPSTPLGFTLISTSRTFDSLHINFWWTDFTTPGHIDPGTNDSLIYWLITGGMHPAQSIADDQDPNNPTDTRFYYTFGDFQVQPAETLKMVFAMVSGVSTPNMLDNARKAQRIYESGGFIMPVVQIADSGTGKPITISWNQILRSPTGEVVAYRIYHGTSSGNYSDSMTVAGLSHTYYGLPESTGHYFAVRAIDEIGNRSAISDEVSNAPYAPKNFRVFGQQTSINLQWDANSDPDIAGYNIYRRVLPDSVFIKINTELVAGTIFFDTAVIGNKEYEYIISGVDKDNYESAKTLPLRGKLIPPAMPKNFVLGTGYNYMRLNWSPNTEEDLAGYNLYRKIDSDINFIKLNDTLLTITNYVDRNLDSSLVYQYYLEAVDKTSALSPLTRIWSGKITRKDAGILLVNTGFYFPLADSIRNFNKTLLKRYYYTENYYPWFSITNPSSAYYLNRFSSIVWAYECANTPPNVIYDFPILLKGYLLGGGKLFIHGRRLTLDSYPHWLNLLTDLFGIDLLTEISNVANFAGAEGEKGFPNLFARQDTTIGLIERFPQIPENRVLYRMKTTLIDSTGNGQPIGIGAKDSTLKAYYLSFPLYYLDSMSAQSVVDYVLNDFGEIPLDVIMINDEIPEKFSLHNAFPNPFNPSTSIRFDLPTEADVSLVVYDLLGKEIARLIDERKPPGSYNVQWDANGVSTGIYFYRISVFDAKSHLRSIETKKVILVK
ncbi:MAG: T9SS type A sorting domain-containing protein [Ignavibacteriales bacterium]|nr:T9SS type A sorting domain-containing protein [Ignavibacteriales bacterium]